MAALEAPARGCRYAARFVDEQAMHQFQCEHLVNRGCVVPDSVAMTVHDLFETVAIPVWSRKSSRIQQYVLQIFGQCIAIPDPKMGEFVTAQKEPLQVEPRQQMVDAS